MLLQYLLNQNFEISKFCFHSFYEHDSGAGKSFFNLEVHICSSLGSIGNGSILYDQNPIDTGTLAYLNCSDGYEPSGFAHVMCKHDGTWNQQIGTCISKANVTILVEYLINNKVIHVRRTFYDFQIYIFLQHSLPLEFSKY